MTAPRRRWFQFSLRTLLMAVTLAAAAMFAYRHQVQWIAARGAFIGQHRVGRLESGSWAWGLGLPGEYRNEVIELDYFASAEDIATAKSLFPEAKIRVNNDPNSIEVKYGWLGDPAFKPRTPRADQP